MSRIIPQAPSPSGIEPGPPAGRGALALGAGEAVARIIAFGAAAYLARQLGPDVYGSIVLATTILLYLARISDCGVDLLGVSDVARSPTQLPSLLPSLLGARLLVTLFLVLALLIAGLALLPPLDAAVLALYGLTLFPLALGTAWANLGLQRAATVSRARIATEALAALLMVILVQSPADVARAPLAQLVGDSLGAFLLLRLLPRPAIHLRDLFRVGLVVSLFRRSWPLVLQALLALVIFNSDFFFLRLYRDSATVAYYAAAYAVVSFFLNVGNSYSLNLLPLMTRTLTDPARQKELYHRALAQVFAGSLPIAVGATLVADRLITGVFGSQYHPAVLPLQLLCWIIPGAMFRSVAQSVLIAHGRQHELLTTAGWAAGGNLALNLLLIPPWGMAGAALATFISATVRLAHLGWYIGALGLRLPSLGRFWRALLAAASMAVAVAASPVPAVWMSIALGALVYFLVLYLTGGIRLRRDTLPELTV